MNAGGYSIVVGVYAVAFQKRPDLHRGELRFSARGHNPEVSLHAVYPYSTDGTHLSDLTYSDGQLRQLERGLVDLALPMTARDWRRIFASARDLRHPHFELAGIAWEYRHAQNGEKKPKVIGMTHRYRFEPDEWLPKSWLECARSQQLVDPTLPNPFAYVLTTRGVKGMESGLDDIIRAFEDSA